MTAAEAEKFDYIRRNAQYGCTIKELVFLCRLVEKLDATVQDWPQAAGASVPRPEAKTLKRGSRK